MKKILSGAYSSLSYAAFLATILYAVGFLANVAVPKSVDSGPVGPIGEAVVINLLLLGLFGIQHSGMARPGFKRVWIRIVPKPIERSTFVLFSCIALGMLYLLWRPLPQVIWQAHSASLRSALIALSMAGWGIVVYSTFLIHHFDLFGLRQVYFYATGQRYRELGFRTPGLYRRMRHPIMLGFLVAFWATPDMTVGHLLFAAVATGYIAVGVFLEERDLVRLFGARYLSYKAQVPALLPFGRMRHEPRSAASEASARS